MTVDSYIQKMTLTEKAAMLQGWTTWTTLGLTRLAIPSIFLSDGPHGLRKQAGPADHLGLNASVPATCFPTAATMANSWNPELGQELGRALGREAAANGVNVVLGPGLNIKRSPLCGRNFEYFSEDPYLAGKMAAAYIRGIQENGVAACPKHFAVNSQELRRMSTDSVVDERTLREIYLTGFEIAVTEGKAKAIMSSYNLVNGTYANENAHLLTEILRGQWGFDGFVVTDWGADNDHVSGVKAGSDLVMPAPGPGCAQELVDAVESGDLDEAVLDARLRELLPVILSTTEAVRQAPKEYDRDAHHSLAKKCAADAIVLLENDGILPLTSEVRVAVIGDFAKQPRYQGAGSSIVNPTRLDNFLDCARDAMNIVSYAQGFSREDAAPNGQLEAEAVEAAKQAQTVLLFVGLDEKSEAEGMDRAHLELPENQKSLIKTICAAHKNVVLVLSGGAPFVLPPENCRAVIHGYLGGQAGAGAMVDALLGKVNPSGKLSESWPFALADCPSTPYFPSREHTAEYREGLYVGYRYYDTADVAVRYPFGYGMSYTSFRYSDLQADKNGVTFTLTNTGSCAGAEVVQVYIACRNGEIFRPKKELKGFGKFYLEAGESKRVSIPLDSKAFRYFNVATGSFEAETANYDILVAASAADIRLSATVRIFGTDAPNPYGDLPSYRTGRIQDVEDHEFEALLGRPIPDGSWSGDIQRNDALCQLYYAKAPVARLLYKVLKKQTGEDGEKPDMLFVFNMPIRGISKLVGKHFSRQMADDFVCLCNGHTFRGAGRLIRDFFRNKSAARKFQKRLEEGPTE